MEQRQVCITEDKNIAIVTMNPDGKANILNFAKIKEIIDVLSELENNDNVKGIILTGKGKSFIVGADINIMKELEPISGVDFISTLQSLMATIRKLKKPVVACVNGYCFGAGLELANSCDLCIASETATFGMQEVKIGIPSVIEAALLPFIVGLNKTRELLLTGEIIGAAEAEKIGLVNYVVKPEELLNECMKYTQKITQNAAHSVSLQKKLIDRWLENAGLEESIKTGIDYFGLSLAYKESKMLLNNAMKKEKS